MSRAVTDPRFVVDVMLGRLAHWLRAMGYDTLYDGQADDHQLLALSLADDRILITRDTALARAADQRGCLIRAEDTDGQLAELVERLALAPPATRWLTRCLECNTALEPRVKDGVRLLVPPRILATHTTFMGCPDCGRVFWRGSHFAHMCERLARLVGRARDS
jgi:uncharacterized protein with PIN domain